jgi:tRNA pseudouridine55 synthase
MLNIQEADFQAGTVLLIDKPLLWTSFDAVNKLRHAIRRKIGTKKIKVGHAGTLDPMATGLLIICTGKFTKDIDSYQNQVKEYTGSFYIGATRPSHDMETEIDQTFDTQHITNELIHTTCTSFLGEQSQLPPIYSAIKQDGKPIYKAARKGEQVEVKPRQVEIMEFEITKIEMPLLHFRVKCSKGTYIRSLAYDFGQRMNSGSYLATLRRTKIGDFDVNNAMSIEYFISEINQAIQDVS